MRVCPKCGHVSNDDEQKFCLMDGAELVAGDSEPTVVMPSGGSIPTVVMAAPQKKRSPVMWVVVTILILLVGGGALAGLLFYVYRLGNEAAKTDRTTNSVPSRTTPTPRATSQSTPTSPASVEPSPGTTDTPEAGTDEVTPISWTTAGSGFKMETGLTYKFLCPETGTPAIIWGSDLYTGDSSICTAAVHAGLITLEKGGEVTIEFNPGRRIYGSTTRNGITSNTYGEYPHSFVVR